MCIASAMSKESLVIFCALQVSFVFAAMPRTEGDPEASGRCLMMLKGKVHHGVSAPVDLFQDPIASKEGLPSTDFVGAEPAAARLVAEVVDAREPLKASEPPKAVVAAQPLDGPRAAAALQTKSKPVPDARDAPKKPTATRTCEGGDCTKLTQAESAANAAALDLLAQRSAEHAEREEARAEKDLSDAKRAAMELQEAAMSEQLRVKSLHPDVTGYWNDAAHDAFKLVADVASEGAGEVVIAAERAKSSAMPIA